ncbi:hypothetical protein SAMN05216369_2825 [Marinobacter antarcticus]|uniref:Uncharacterized protein n=1 Tax=Marinobacter antarcticus TaxID=564117 RepID=A0A1M6UHA6_9GAMM|nr:hypothetical protein [Marinobacter antarcticus]SHK68478.1 hypothetical protein SAMN05216369_2825 [Marinobacter antarcticus]
MQSNDNYIFDQYEAKSGVTPSYFDPDFYDIEATASELLGRFSPSEIAQAVKSFDDFLHARSPDFNPSSEDWLNGDLDGDYCGGAQTMCLNSLTNKGIDPSEAFGCSLKMYEAYAMAALAIIAVAVREEARLDRSGDVEELYWRFGRYAIEGSKLAYAAKVLNLNPELKVPVDQYRKTVASKGGKGKSQKYLPLKKAIYGKWLDQHQGRSNRDAARRIWQSLPAEINCDYTGKSILNPADPETTVAKWIGAFSKGDIPQ